MGGWILAHTHIPGHTRQLHRHAAHNHSMGQAQPLTPKPTPISPSTEQGDPLQTPLPHTPVTTAQVSAPSSQPASPPFPMCYRRDFGGENPRPGGGT